MGYFQQYTSSLDKPGLVASTIETAESVVGYIEEHFDFTGQFTGLLLGNVQSGKTGQMLGIMSKMADCGYNVFLLLTSDNIDLQRQTYNRVQRSLPSFLVVSENETELFPGNGLSRPVVVVAKKNGRILKKWANLFASSSIMKGACLCIFDDEADNASLNTLVNRDRVSTINRCLQKIKDTAASTIYFEVTATPQAVILQSKISGWKPSYIKYFQPGEGYLGGDFFYSEPRSFCIRFTADNELDDIVEEADSVCPEGLRKSVMTFLVICAYKRLNGETNCNFMIHPSMRISIHQRFTDRVREYLNLLQSSTEDEGFHASLLEAWRDLQSTKPDLPHYEDIKTAVCEILDETLVCVIPLNSQSFVSRDPNDPDALKLDQGYNIIVGGNTLGRGLTFPNLQVVYYCRTSRTPQADTFWQHSRVFGYDREKALVRIYMPERLHTLFVALNEANNVLIKQVEAGVDNIELVFPNDIRPTRKNVLDNRYLNMVVGGTNMYAHYPKALHTEVLNHLIEHYKTQESAEVDTDLLIQVLALCESEDPSDFNSQRFIACIRALQQKRPTIKGRLIVRTDRDITKGTGTLLSPTDRLLGDRHWRDIVLTMYRITGAQDKGWTGVPLWIPNIRFPNDTCYYDTME